MLMIAVSGRRPQDTLPHAPSRPPFPLQLQNPDTGNSRGPRPTLTVQPAKWTIASTPCLHSRAPANSNHCLVLPSAPSCEVGITIPVCREASCIAERGWFSIHPHTHRTQHDVQPPSSVHLSVCPPFPPRCAQHLKTLGSGTPHLQAPRGMCCPSLFSSDSGRIRTARTLC